MISPFSINVHMQILQTDLHRCPYRISIFRLHYFPFDGHFIKSHYICIDIVRSLNDKIYCIHAGHFSDLKG